MELGVENRTETFVSELSVSINSNMIELSLFAGLLIIRFLLLLLRKVCQCFMSLTNLLLCKLKFQITICHPSALEEMEALCKRMRGGRIPARYFTPKQLCFLLLTGIFYCTHHDTCCYRHLLCFYTDQQAFPASP